jgi:hypothetical protein
MATMTEEEASRKEGWRIANGWYRNYIKLEGAFEARNLYWAKRVVRAYIIGGLVGLIIGLIL